MNPRRDEKHDETRCALCGKPEASRMTQGVRDADKCYGHWFRNGYEVDDPHKWSAT